MADKARYMNIAEGFRKRSKADKGRFMNMAEGSVEESRYYLILAQDLGYGQTETLMNSLQEVSRLLSAYARASDFWLLTSVSRRSRDIKGEALPS